MMGLPTLFLGSLLLSMCSLGAVAAGASNAATGSFAAETTTNAIENPKKGRRLGLVQQLFPQKLRCALAFRRNGFNLDDFANYPKFFGKESIVELAQAGQYKGAADIEEYVKFLYNNYSPYLLDANFTPSFRENKILGLNYATRQCEYVGLYKFGTVFDPAATLGAVIPRFDTVALTKLFLDVKSNIVSRMNVYFTTDFLRIYFAVALNTTATRNYLCNDVWTRSCAGILPQPNASSGRSNSSNSSAFNEHCEDGLKALPVADGSLLHIDGNSLGCRALHGAFAQTNPTMHCAHLSLEPLADPMGRFKCQNKTTKDVDPKDLFSEADFEAFRSFARKVGIDPTKGHDLQGF